MNNGNKEEIDKVSLICRISYVIAFLLPALFAFSMQRLLASFPLFVERVFSLAIFRWISLPISYVSAVFPFSLTEAALYLSIPGIIVFIVMIIRRIKKSANKRKTVLKYLHKIAWICSVLYLIFMLLHGFNYSRMPLADSLGIDVRPRDADELEEVCYILLDRVNYLREDLQEENGTMVLTEGVDVALKNGYQGYEALENVYPVLKGPSVRAKGVLASRYWSYTRITGMYFPFFVEANVNIDVPHYSIPNTIMHELAHLRGIAREDEAEFTAFITGINHPEDHFKYSSYLNAFMHCRSALYGSDEEAFKALSSRVSQKVWSDLSAGGAYWKQFEGPVAEVSTKVNDSYLKANLQEDGVRSYGRVVDLILGYYLSDDD